MHGNPLGLIFVIAIIVIVVWVTTKGYRKPTAEKAKAHPYERRRYLLSRAERSFLGVLEQAVGTQYRIMAKVRLADVVDVERRLYGNVRKYAFYRIQSKHLDFVACDPSTFSVEFVVELDDGTHSRSDRSDRDEFVDRSLQAAGVPIFRFTALGAYSVPEIRKVILIERAREGGTTKNVESGSRGFFSPGPHTTRHAGPHRAVPKD